MTNQDASPSSKATKRKRLFVDNRVQGSLIRQLVAHWFLACFLMFCYLFAMQAFSNGFALGFVENFQVLSQQYGLLFVILLVLSPVFIYDSVKLSNRFAGPMVSFRASLKRLARGENIREVSFRENDFWKELSTDLNSVAKELRTFRSESVAADADQAPST